MLVDTGPEPGPLADCLELLGIERVDALFLTHLHADHTGGLSALHDVDVDLVLYSTAGSRPPDPVRGIRPARAQAGQRGVAGSVRWDVLGPAPDHRAGSENDASLVVLFTVAPPGAAPVTFLATGDAEEQALSGVLAAHPGLRADVLKVSHHGATNGGTEVIRTVRPDAALIGVGAGNRYGHPTPPILEALAGVGAETYRTDLAGTVTIDLRRGERAVVRGTGGVPEGG